MSYKPHGAWRTMEVLEELALVSLDTSIGTSGRYDPPCGCGETHLFQVESPTLWNRTVLCTLLLFTYAHSFLKNGADLTLYVWRVI
jgi:hypothetical protein